MNARMHLLNPQQAPRGGRWIEESELQWLTRGAYHDRILSVVFKGGRWYLPKFPCNQWALDAINGPILPDLRK